jgi:hypothetical protein
MAEDSLTRENTIVNDSIRVPRRRVRSLIIVLLNLGPHVIFAFYDGVQLFCRRTIGFTHGCH